MARDERRKNVEKNGRAGALEDVPVCASCADPCRAPDLVQRGGDVFHHVCDPDAPIHPLVHSRLARARRTPGPVERYLDAAADARTQLPRERGPAPTGEQPDHHQEDP